MKILLTGVLLLPFSAAAEGFIEAFETAQITGLENTYPAWSPDGTKIVFESTRNGPDADIFLMNADGSNVVQLTRNDSYDGTPAWTPDGTRLLWRRIAPTGGKSESGRNSEVFWMDLKSGEQRNLTSNQAYDGWPAWSPDGRRIAFASNRANSEFEAFDIYVAEADGSNPTRVTFGNGIEGTGSWTKPGFSADGRRILCTRTVGTSVDIFVITLR